MPNFIAGKTSLQQIELALLGEVAGKKILADYADAPYACFPNVVKSKKGFQIKGFEGKLPMVYSIIARKESQNLRQ